MTDDRHHSEDMLDMVDLPDTERTPCEVWTRHPVLTRYEVSDQGRVRMVNGEPRKLKSVGRGYVGVNIVKDGKHQTMYVHRLVLEAFRGMRLSAKHEASHLNGNRQDNRLANLIWETTKENARRRGQHGTSGAGENNSMAKLSWRDALAIKYSTTPTHIVAAAHGISQGTVNDIKAGRTWSSVI